MCGRYWIDRESPEELDEIIAQMQRMENPPKTGGEICPGDRAAVVARSRSGKIRPSCAARLSESSRHAALRPCCAKYIHPLTCMLRPPCPPV